MRAGAAPVGAVTIAPVPASCGRANGNNLRLNRDVNLGSRDIRIVEAFGKSGKWRKESDEKQNENYILLHKHILALNLTK